MKVHKIILIIIVLSLSQAFAIAIDTVWTKVFGGSKDEKAYCVDTTYDGGFVLAGYTESSGVGGRDVFVVRADSNGNKLWEKTFGGKRDDMAYYIQSTVDRGFILTGTTRSYRDTLKGDVLVIKLDSMGNELWSRQYGCIDINGCRIEYPDSGHCVRENADKGYIITGKSCDLYDFYGRFILIRTDSQGNTMWANQYNLGYAGVGPSGAYSGLQTNDGGFIAVGNGITIHDVINDCI